MTSVSLNVKYPTVPADYDSLADTKDNANTRESSLTLNPTRMPANVTSSADSRDKVTSLAAALSLTPTQMPNDTSIKKTILPKPSPAELEDVNTCLAQLKKIEDAPFEDKLSVIRSLTTLFIPKNQIHLLKLLPFYQACARFTLCLSLGEGDSLWRPSKEAFPDVMKEERERCSIPFCQWEALNPPFMEYYQFVKSLIEQGGVFFAGGRSAANESKSIHPDMFAFRPASPGCKFIVLIDLANEECDHRICQLSKGKLMLYHKVANYVYRRRGGRAYLTVKDKLRFTMPDVMRNLIQFTSYKSDEDYSPDYLLLFQPDSAYYKQILYNLAILKTSQKIQRKLIAIAKNVKEKRAKREQFLRIFTAKIITVESSKDITPKYKKILRSIYDAIFQPPGSDIDRIERTERVLSTQMLACPYQTRLPFLHSLAALDGALRGMRPKLTIDYPLLVELFTKAIDRCQEKVSDWSDATKMACKRLEKLDSKGLLLCTGTTGIEDCIEQMNLDTVDFDRLDPLSKNHKVIHLVDVFPQPLIKLIHQYLGPGVWKDFSIWGVFHLSSQSITRVALTCIDPSRPALGTANHEFDIEPDKLVLKKETTRVAVGATESTIDKRRRKKEVRTVPPSMSTNLLKDILSDEVPDIDYSESEL